jgi:hypothetical protein
MTDALQIEKYASQIAEPDFDTASIDPLIGHLSDAEIDIVMDRAADIAQERGPAAMAESDALKNLSRLAHAAGMPAGGKPIPWLQERGLIERVGDGWRFKTAKPESAA